MPIKVVDLKEMAQAEQPKRTRTRKPTAVEAAAATETPAAEVVRKSLGGGNYRPEELDRLRADVQGLLQGKGFRRMAFGTAAFDPGAAPN